MNKLAKLIQQLPPNELVLIQKDVQTGTLQRLIDEELKKRQRGAKKTCPVCGTAVYQNQGIRLEFGPEDLRQQAHFDATDCLTHFIEHTLKKKSQHHKNT